MNITQDQHKALDDALVAPTDHLEFGKCNMRLKTYIKPKEAKFQVVLDALALTPFYHAFLITADKHFQDTKGTKIKTKAKVAKSDKKKQPAKKPKAKGLAVLFEVALSEAKKLKLATKRSKTQFHSSHASVSDKGTGTIPGVPDVPIYEFESEKESWGDSNEKDDDEDDFDDSDENDESDDERTKSDRDEISDPNKTNEEHNEEEEEYDDEFNIEKEEKIDDEESMDEEEEDEVTKEMYDDVNVNLGNKDADMTDADHANNEIASLMDTTAQHATTIPEITSSFTTTIPPPPPFFNSLSQQATPTPSPMASKTTTSLHVLLDFDSVFKFNEKVFNLEKDVSKIKQVDQYAQALSSIPAIVDRYMDNKLREAINKAIQAHNFDYVATPVIEKNVTESVEAAVLTRSSSQPTSTYEATASLSEFELTKILIDKIEKNNRLVQKPERPPNPDPDWSKRQQAARAEEPPTSFDELYDTSFDFSEFFINRLKIPNLTQEIMVGPAFNLLKGTCKSITESEYHIEECSKATTERLDCHNPKNKPYPFDLRKPLSLIQDHRGRQIIPKD
ncbi:hypothetical protein Tco_0624022 [Tanacetum coccineum]|uniref:Reverse transcriptase domain-containing protein n=1 Tax=Tanacetum coccineum TaxID=301880 RepID=A0ABQ4WCS1_9ASTR